LKVVLLDIQGLTALLIFTRTHFYNYNT